MKTGKVFYARQDDLVVFKFIGEIHYTVGDSYRITSSLDSFIERLLKDADFQNVLLDLTEAVSIDSTNLGLLARIGKYMLDKFNRKATILSTNEDVNTILESVGFDQVFLILHQTDDSDIACHQLPDTSSEDTNLAKIILRAHHALVELNDKNKEMFKDVVRLLEENMDDKA